MPSSPTKIALSSWSCNRLDRAGSPSVVTGDLALTTNSAAMADTALGRLFVPPSITFGMSVIVEDNDVEAFLPLPGWSSLCSTILEANRDIGFFFGLLLGAVAVVNGVGNAGDDADHVDDEESGGRDEQSGPLEEVEFSEVGVVGGFGSDGEVGVDAGEDFEEALEDGEEVGRDAADDPELLVPPPVLDADAAPAELQDAGGDDGGEESDEPDARQVVQLQCNVINYRGDDELSGEQTDGGDGAVSEQRNGSERIDDGVRVCESLQPFEISSIAVPQRAMPAEEDLDGAESPPENLVQPVGEIDRSRSFESRPVWCAVNRSPASAVHLESR
ncbi:hypothetical protein M5K25_001450 [Dendrobium thyrsiflorum]|uniref:Uncharacterized protein n=1 Tax=Dendrobium thyrsiflorum TaxID=117978 RepID=A0ABD0VQD8_DENTH